MASRNKRNSASLRDVSLPKIPSFDSVQSLSLVTPSNPLGPQNRTASAGRLPVIDSRQSIAHSTPQLSCGSLLSKASRPEPQPKELYCDETYKIHGPKELQAFLIDTLLVWTILGSLILTFLFGIHPTARKYTKADVHIQEPYQPVESVPSWLAFAMGFVLPLFSILAMSLYHRTGGGVNEACAAIYGLISSGLYTCALTCVFKSTIGELRPDFLARVSTGIPEVIEEGRMAFPSAHASTAFSGLGFFAWYLAGKISTFKNPTVGWRTLLPLLSLSLATFVAASRVMDNRHHPGDVAGGSVLGIVFSLYIYWRTHHSFTGPQAGRPRFAFIRDMRTEVAALEAEEAGRRTQSQLFMPRTNGEPVVEPRAPLGRPTTEIRRQATQPRAPSLRPETTNQGTLPV